jgi:LCP family protein required for cell wall assembly
MSAIDPVLRDNPAGPGQAHRPAPASRLFLLTALWPGLGHLAAGRRRWAAILGLPPLILLLVLGGAAVIAVLGGTTSSFAARFIDPAVLGALLALEAILLLWRLAALGLVGSIAPFRPALATTVAAVVAVVIVVGPQVWAANLTIEARDAALAVFEPVDSGGAWVPDQTAPPVESNDPDFGIDASPSLLPSTSAGASASASASPSAAPSATPGVPRVNVLLIGMDSGVGRNTALTDTMIVASLDPVAKTVSMASIPRDMVDVPLPDGRTFRGKINSLVSYVRWHPGKFPGAKDGQSVLTAALGDLLGLKIDLWAQVNLGGFVHLVDSVGGVNINVTTSFCDPTYDEYGINGFGVSPGRYHMNGNQALAYARIRHAAGESDFTRAARQQEVIAALRDRLVAGAFLDNPGRFLKSLGQTISTNIKPSFLADYIDVAAKVQRKDTFRVVIQHPLVRGTSDARGSIQVPDLKAIRVLAAKLFAPTGTRPKGFDTMTSAGTGSTKRAPSSSTCGIRAAPKPTVKPKPTPRPTAKPHATATTGPTPKPTPTPTPEPPTPAPTPEPPTPTPSP